MFSRSVLVHAMEHARGNTYCFAKPLIVARLVLLAAFVFAALPFARAQLSLGSLSGTVTDASGAALPNASVSITNVDIAFTRSATTDGNGHFAFSALSAGNYRLSASGTGMSTKDEVVGVAAGQGARADLQLTVGSATETITVQAQDAQTELQRDSHNVNQLLEPLQLTDLPTNGLNVLTTAALAAGAQTGGTINSQSGGSSGYFQQTGNQIILSGQSVGNTQFLLDGNENINLLTAGANINPDPYAVSELDVESNGMSARYTEPGVVNVLTKTGTEHFHGVLYDYLQTQTFNALNYFSHDAPPSSFTSNQFGANLGGPIIRNKLFFFFDYNGTRSHSISAAETIVPTALERNGDFSQSGTPIYDYRTYNPAANTIAPFTYNGRANVIDPSLISQYAKALLSYVPLPNATAPTYNYITTVRNVGTYDAYFGRLDYNISNKDTLHGVVQRASGYSTSPQVLANYFTAVYPASGTNTFIEETHIFTPNVLNVAHVGYNRAALSATTANAGDEDYAAQFGLNNLNQSKNLSTPPLTNPDGNLYMGGASSPQTSVQNRFEYQDELDYTRGKHHLAFGEEVSRIQFDGSWVLYQNGYIVFGNQYSSDHGTMTPGVYGGGNPTADMLLGLPTYATAATTSMGNGTSGAFREYELGTYVQDDWKLTDKLTLNLGGRWGYFQPPSDTHHLASTFDVTTGTTLPGTWNPEYTNFSPRIGFAYSPDKSTVFSGGYGTYYARYAYNALQFTLLHQPNFAAQSPTLTILNPTPVSQVFVAHPSASIEQPLTLGRSMPQPYTQQWNLRMQRTLGNQWTAWLAYVGNGGRHQSRRVDGNPAAPSTDPNPADLPSRRLINPNLGDTLSQLNIGNSNYNGLQATLQRRFSGGLYVLATYSWSKSLDYLTTDNFTLPSPYLAQDKQFYSYADYDTPQALAVTVQYLLPYKPSNALLKATLGGWEVSEITRLNSGLPYSVIASAATANIGGNGAQFFADQVCDPRQVPGGRSKTEWFNTACFVQPAAGRFGTAKRNAVRGPSYKDTDLSLFKSFSIGGERSVQFRADAFNLFNHPSFLLGSYEIASQSPGSPIGQLTGATAPRNLQFSLRLAF